MSSTSARFEPVPDDERPLRADAERNRLRLLEAAVDVFAERGLEASMDEIARAAGVGVGTAYRRFRSRDELIDALFERRVDEIVAIAEEAARDEDAWRGLTTFMERMLALHVANRALKELFYSSTHARRRGEQLRARMVPLVAGIVERARESGELRADASVTDIPLSNMMIGTVGEFTRDVDPDVWRRYLGIVLDGLRARREGPTPLPAEPLDPERLQAAMKSWPPKR